MIRPLRRAHRVASLLLALVVVATMAAALSLRVAAPVVPLDALRGQPMSITYRAVGWNAHKRAYDSWIAGGVATLLALTVGAGALVQPAATVETLLIRGLAVTALVLLHVILSIGPLCRLDRRLLPLLYNRRHLGVSMCLVALAHGTFALVQFHTGGDADPLMHLLTSGSWTSAADVPFQLFGAGALVIVVTMAATSHDFWLHTLTAPVWKALHMSVYLAYALIVAHVAFGALQTDRSPVLAAALGAGAAWIAGLHLAVAWREPGATAKRPARRGSTYAPWPRCRCRAQSWPVSRANGSPCSGMATACRRCRTCASTRTDRSAKGRS